MEARLVHRNHRLIYPASFAVIGLFSLVSTFSKDLYKSPAQVVLVSTALCMWAFACIMFSKLSQATFARLATTILSGLTVTSMITASNVENQSAVTAFAFLCASLAIAISAQQLDLRFSLITGVVNIVFVLAGLAISKIFFEQFALSIILAATLLIEYAVVRISHIPVAQSLNEALERAEIFSTITKSSREFHSREPEEAIRNIVNVTKTLGYISVSVVSFDRRQKIFEDGVPIPNVMDIAVRASATRRVTITQDEQTGKTKRSRHGDIVGVPIWINGRYSAALIVQTSSHSKLLSETVKLLNCLQIKLDELLKTPAKQQWTEEL